MKRLATVTLSILISVCVLFLPFGATKARAHEPFELTISTLPAGFASYALGVGIAELINKNSSWLKAVHIEGRGPVEHMKLLVKNPARRKNYLFFNTTWDLWEAKKGIGPYAKFSFNYDEFKFVSLFGIAANGLCTLNPKIKTLKDLVGKRVIFDSAPNKGRILVYKGILEAAGLPLDKIKFQYASGKSAADAMRDGLVDVIYLGAGLRKLPNIFALSPFIAELVATKDVYFISFEKKYVEAFKAKTGHPVSFMEVPPKIFGPLQTKPCGILVKPLAFSAHISMPDDVITEVLRILYENAHLLKQYAAMGEIITKDTLASLGVPEEAYHPAAVRFFKAKGIKITGFGF